MNMVRVRDITIGEGAPKICVPIVGRSREEILRQMEEGKASGADLAEWRADWYEALWEPGRLEEMLLDLREGLGNLPLLVTFRTAGEGGEQEIGAEEYEEFLMRALASGKADLLDVELFMGEGLLKGICVKAHERGVRVVASSHDFQKTPPKEEIISRLRRMQEAGADLLKMAAMPLDAGDVLTLLTATWEMRRRFAAQPLITMSMGKLGLISRISGEIFGSAMTFGAAGRGSAPGQIGAEELRRALGILGGEEDLW